jgi:hypothetical protein
MKLDKGNFLKSINYVQLFEHNKTKSYNRHA